MEKVIKKDEDAREQAISIIAKHVNNEIFTERELAEVVLDLALAQATNAKMFVRIIKELCKKDEYTLSILYAKQFGYLVGLKKLEAE